MPSLFSGVENFTPAFTGRQLAIESGRGAGQSIARGTQAMQREDQLKLESDQFDFQKKQVEDVAARLPMFKSWLDSKTSGGDSGGADASGVTPKAWSNSGSGQTLNVGKAQRIIKAFTDDPSWLADPRTSQAANAVFSAAGKVIGMNLQLERLNNSSLAAREEQSMVAKQVKMASEIVSANPMATLSDGRPVSSMWGKDQDGMAAVMDISNLGEISALHGKHVPKPVTGALPSDVQLLEFAKQYRTEGDETNAARLEAVVTERGRNKGAAQKIERNVTVTETDDSGNKVTRRLTDEEAATVPVPTDKETAKMLSDYAIQKAALATGDKFASFEWMEIGDRARKLGELKIKLEQKGINPDTGTRLSSPAASTNAPAASAPASKIVIQNGQRFQVNADGTSTHLGPAQ